MATKRELEVLADNIDPRTGEPWKTPLIVEPPGGLRRPAVRRGSWLGKTRPR